MTDSPFLPGTRIQYAWDSTSLGYLKRCPRLYYYVVLGGYHTKDESVHLRFGIEYHHALQSYDLSIAAGIRHDDAVFDVVRDLLIRTWGWESDHETKNRFTLLRTVIWHLDSFHDEPAKVVKREDGKPMVELSFRFELDWGPASVQGKVSGVDEQGVEFGPSQPYLLCGHLDRAVEFAGERYIEDYKTSKYSLTSWYFDKYSPDNQMTLYSIAGQVVLGSPVKGVIVRGAQIAEDVTNFGRGIVMRTKGQQREWLDDLHYWFAMQEQFAIADHWPMNDTSCDKYGGCPFRQVCNVDPSVRDRVLASNYIQLPEEERWNPLKVR